MAGRPAPNACAAACDSSPSVSSASMPARFASAPTSACSAGPSAPSSPMSPSTRMRRPGAAASTAMAALTESGLALYVSSISAAPFVRELALQPALAPLVVLQSPRRRCPGRCASACATAQAASALRALCSPGTRSRTPCAALGRVALRAHVAFASRARTGRAPPPADRSRSPSPARPPFRPRQCSAKASSALMTATPSPQAFVDLALGLGDRLARAELAEMRGAGVGDERHCRARRAAVR